MNPANLKRPIRLNNRDEAVLEDHDEFVCGPKPDRTEQLEGATSTVKC